MSRSNRTPRRGGSESWCRPGFDQDPHPVSVGVAGEDGALVRVTIAAGDELEAEFSNGCWFVRDGSISRAGPLFPNG